MRALAFGILALCFCLAALPQDEPLYKFGTTVVGNSGFRGLIYNIKPDSTRLPNFKKLKPVGAIYTPELNIPVQNFLEGFPGVTNRFEWFAIDYTARFWVEKPGFYRFALTSDDGSRLYIDDQQVIENDGIHSAQLRQAGAELTNGVHTMRVSFFQGPRAALALILQVATPDDPKLKVFNTNDFKPPAGTEIPPLAPMPVKK